MNRRRRFQKKKPNRYSKWYKYASRGASLAAKALTVALATRKLLNVERKYLDTNSSIADQSTTATLVNLSIVPQGDTANTRDGQSIRAKFLSFHATIDWATGVAGAVARVMLIMQKSQTVPTASNLFEFATSVLSPRNRDYQKDFAIIRKGFFINPDQRDLTKVNFMVKLNNHMEWTQADTDGTNPTRGQIWLYFISNQATGTNGPGLSYVSRLNYIDN